MLRTSNVYAPVLRGGFWKRVVLGALVAMLAVDSFGLRSLGVREAAACPFCSASQMTLSEDLRANDVAVICKLVNRPPKQDADAPPEASECTFEIVQTLKGADIIARQADPKHIKILYFGEKPIGSTFLAFGIDPANLAWGTPTLLSERAVKYVTALPTLPESGPKRLVFFQDYFEDADTLLASDAYDEFAKAPYADLKGMKDQMQHDKLLAWIKDPNVTTTRRRLYLCMLSVCGKPEDVAFLEAMIQNNNRQIRTALDAMIGSYLALKGPEGMPLIENLFLKNAKAEYTDTYSTLMALRFMAQESDVISRDRLKEGMRHMLDNPRLADLVVPDLTRWQDWTVMDRLVTLFKEADKDSAWVRVPVVNYLRACPLPEAKVHLAELAKIDPEAVRRAINWTPSPGAAASETGTPKDPAAAATPATTVPPSTLPAGS